MTTQHSQPPQPSQTPTESQPSQSQQSPKTSPPPHANHPSHRPHRTFSTPTVYIVDTNVLHLWLSYRPDAEPPEWSKQEPESWKRLQERQSRAAQFCTNPNHRIIVPAIVWIELYGLFLQKDIELEQYELWRRLRRASLEQLDRLLYATSSHISLDDALVDTELAINLSRHPASPQLLEEMRQGLRRRKPTPDGRIPPAKGLDGVDSAILAYAWQYAQLHPHLLVRVLSDDHGIGMMLSELHRCQAIYSHSVPANLGYRNVWGKQIPSPHQLSVSYALHPEDREARRLFNAGDYEGAAERWQHLTQQQPDPRPHQICTHLAQAYAAWSQLDYALAHSTLTQLHQKLEQFKPHPQAWPVGIDPTTSTLLLQQQDILQLLATHIDNAAKTPDLQLLQQTDWVHALVRDQRANARRYTLQKQYTPASLLFYRLAELLAQRRLATHQIDPSHATYDHLAIPVEELLSQFSALCQTLHFDPPSQLPLKIDLLKAYLLLQTLQDPYAKDISLQKLNGVMKARNQTIFAHGFVVVKPEMLERMRKEIDNCLTRFWKAEGISAKEAHAQQPKHEFIQLPIDPLTGA